MARFAARPARPFSTGSEVDAAEVAQRLASAGVEGVPAWMARLPYRKIAVALRDGSGFVKLAEGAFATGLARREAAAYAAPPPQSFFVRPVLRRFHDSGDWTALHFSWIDGVPERSWRSLLPRRGPFEGEETTVHTLSFVLAAMAPEAPGPSAFADARRALLVKDGDRPVSCGRAHGDFIYWNVLRRHGAAPALIDFEHSLPLAPYNHDRLHWTAVPLLRCATDLGGDQAVSWIARRLAPLVIEPHLTASFLIHFGMRLEEEQRAAAVLGEGTSPQFRRRARLLALLERLVRAVVR